jgi:GNAT superfamily N-acetyltransferase
MQVRDAQPDEIEQLSWLWFEGWHDAHGRLLPPELVGDRSAERLRGRLEEMLPSVRVAGERGTPLGFHVVEGDELNQLYVAAEARGMGVAAALVADAEARMADAGVDVAWLACAIGNERAARFYEKCGWRRIGVMTSYVTTAAGRVPLEVWRYEKLLVARPRLARSIDGRGRRDRQRPPSASD